MIKKNSPFFNRLFKYFVQGLFYTVPIAVTVYVIFYLAVLLDSIITMQFPGLGILVILSGVTIIGFIGTYFLSYFKPFDRAIENTPLIKLVYTSMKDLMNAFVGKKKQFNKPVLVKMGNGFEAERLGFITKADLSDLGIDSSKVAVYFPFSYAISGEVIIVPKKNITAISASSADVMKLIVSGGLTSVEATEKIENKSEDE